MHPWRYDDVSLAGDSKVSGLLQLCEVGYFFEEGYFHLVVVDVAAVVLHAVAYKQVVGMECTVVGIYLLKHFLSDADVWSFVLHDDARTSTLAVEEYTVASAVEISYLDADLIGQQCGRISFLRDEVVYEMLPYPFLWGESHVALTELV